MLVCKLEIMGFVSKRISRAILQSEAAIFFIVAPSILIFIQFIHQQMHIHYNFD